jgi:hypothetical protein
MSHLLVRVLQASILSVPLCTCARLLMFGKKNRIISGQQHNKIKKNIINMIEQYDNTTISQYNNTTI